MITEGTKVLLTDGTKAEVVKVFKNGKVKVRFWLDVPCKVHPVLWTQTVRAAEVTAR